MRDICPRSLEAIVSRGENPISHCCFLGSSSLNGFPADGLSTNNRELAGVKRIRGGRRSVFLLGAFMLIWTLPCFAGEQGSPVPVHPLMILPFVFLLLSIAIIPVVNRLWWERRYPLAALGFGAITVVYYLFVIDNPGRMLHTGFEYVSFIILIGSLFVVSGGIHIRIRGKSTPLTNVLVLLAGGLLSNVLGTTGASMILIRPYLRVNRYRLRSYHVVFFIFIVSNIGGALTPIGDPPLFLGYLRGIPFFWVMESVWHIWLLVVGLVLLVFFAIDRWSFRRWAATGKHLPASELREAAEASGLHNCFFLGIIVASVFVDHPVLLRELLMLIAAAGSYVMTKRDIHRKNEFNLTPLTEVAILFAGIFATMVPALDWLELNASKIGVESAGQFYWGAGILSSVLDNAPTYLNFLSAAVGLFIDENTIVQVRHLVSTHGSDASNIVGAHAAEIRNTFTTLMNYHSGLVASGSVSLQDINICYLLGNHSLYVKAISLAAVFFGANTYIGNGPNFMVKSIAEHSGAEVPSFGGFIVKYSLPILIPIFALVWWLFIR